MGGFKLLKTYQRLLLTWQHAIVIVVLTTALHPTDVQLPVAGFLTKPRTAEKVAWVLADHFFRKSPSHSIRGPEIRQ